MINFLKFKDVQEILVDPYTKDPLLFDGKNLINPQTQKIFPLINDPFSYLLFPSQIIPYCKKDFLDWVGLINTKDPLNQYFGLSYIKWNGGEHNSSYDGEYYKNYLNNFKFLIADAKGKLLDIGCDDPINTQKCFPSNIDYVGLDPLYYISSPLYKIYSVCEFLPFQDECFDSICFGTSLDHAFDEYLAVAEAVRVLKKGGYVYLATLVWLKNTELYKDSVHFHHFRQTHIEQLLKENGLTITESFKTSWKQDVHREVLFLKALKQ